MIIEQHTLTAVRTKTGQVFSGQAFLLATGHSARDIFTLLQSKNIQIEANPSKGLDAASIGLLNKQSMRLFNLHERLYTLIDSLDKTVVVISKGDTNVPVIKEKLNKLDLFKREIVELNRKSIFFDEFKYRRRVSDLYVSVANGLEPLSPIQEKGIAVLEDQFLVFQKRFFDLIK